MAQREGGGGLDEAERTRAVVDLFDALNASVLDALGQERLHKAKKQITQATFDEVRLSWCGLQSSAQIRLPAPLRCSLTQGV